MGLVTKKLLLVAIGIAFILSVSTPALAGAPICNVDGAGGVGVTATAWITSSSNDDTSFLDGWIQKPTIGMWHGYFHDIDTDFNAYVLNFGIKDRVELSGARATASVENGPTIKMDSFGAKINLIKENSFSSSFVPAVSVGATYRVNHDIQGMDDDKGLEYYLVASKIAAGDPLPFPLILNAGAIYTDAQQRGLFGFNDDEDALWFFDFAGIVPLFPNWSYFTTCFPGVECRSGASYDDGYEEEDTWIAYCDLLATDNLIIALAHIWNGNPRNGDPFSRSKVGLGDGFIFMLDYDF